MSKYAIPATIVSQGGFVVEASNEECAKKRVRTSYTAELNISHAMEPDVYDFESPLRLEMGEAKEVNSEIEGANVIRRRNASETDQAEIRAMYFFMGEKDKPCFYDVYINGRRIKSFVHDPDGGVEGGIAAEHYVEGWFDSRSNGIFDRDQTIKFSFSNYTFRLASRDGKIEELTDLSNGPIEIEDATIMDLRVVHGLSSSETSKKVKSFVRVVQQGLR